MESTKQKRKETDFRAAQQAIHAILRESTDGTYNEGIALAATVWISLLMTCYKGDHDRVLGEMRNTVETVSRGCHEGEFGANTGQLH
jgi:hypothetical protein